MVIDLFIHTDEPSNGAPGKVLLPLTQGNPRQKHLAYSIQIASFSIPGNDTRKILNTENQVGTRLADQIMQ